LTGFLAFSVNGRDNGHGQNQNPAAETGAWNCSDKQKNLIQKIVTENHLETSLKSNPMAIVFFLSLF
jgi:hypothetical protein